MIRMSLEAPAAVVVVVVMARQVEKLALVEVSVVVVVWILIVSLFFFSSYACLAFATYIPSENKTLERFCGARVWVWILGSVVCVCVWKMPRGRLGSQLVIVQEGEQQRSIVVRRRRRLGL